jgi:hypothetical protein
MVMVLLIKVKLPRLPTWLLSGNFHAFSSVKTIFMVWELQTIKLLPTPTTLLEETPFQDSSAMLKTSLLLEKP